MPTPHRSPSDELAQLRARAERAEQALARVADLALDMRTWAIGTADPLRYADEIANALLPPGRIYLPGQAIQVLEKWRRRP
ncbi:hypothetical protein FHS43_000556 [Streptosporangium becharense]|uniref:Uncharacterized protein n=1 Tax=Streptosporangium becharense TaxID=1816182 RepID=A0A7W9IN78_9ACTN|nr:hypothetical protein [Streptosporangium becharense]MBB2909310.1 hypothetical protein [Streptosporangium becharense]MBB5823787.1 hypothetical protein [Streptosporangium becharense]